MKSNQYELIAEIQTTAEEAIGKIRMLDADGPQHREGRDVSVKETLPKIIANIRAGRVPGYVTAPGTKLPLKTKEEQIIEAMEYAGFKRNTSDWAEYSRAKRNFPKYTLRDEAFGIICKCVSNMAEIVNDINYKDLQ